eukprot:g10764.t1
MQPWQTKVICAGRYRPRQFEYHPKFEDVVVFGTLRGEAVVADVASNSVCSSIPSGLSRDKRDSILGLCWLKQSPTRFVVGSSYGCLRLCDAAAIPSMGARAGAAAKALDKEGCDLTKRSNAVQEAMPFSGSGPSGASSTRPAVPAQRGMGGQFAQAGRVINEFENFEKLTSVHINSTDDQLLASGYNNGVKLFDLSTGQVVRAFDEIHGDHINISRFANHSPFVFATSSFDKTVKAWDSRVRADNSPIYTCSSEMGHVMLSFSPDDVFLLTSAVDNEVKQYLALDGRLHMDLEIPKTGMDENFTRSYYTSSGRLILSGSSEEQTVRLYCAQTGRLIHSAEMYPGRKHGSLYVQSLRGDPHHDFQFSVLVNYRDTAYPLEIVTVDMLQGRDGEDLSSLTAYASSSRLSADLGNACENKDGADVFVVARDRSRFLAHKAVISCRSRVLEGLLADASASGRKEKPDDAGASKLRLLADSGEDCNTSAVLTAPETNGGGEGTMTASVCLPRAVAPDIVPVILAFLYTDKLVQEPDFSHDGFAEEYLDPEGKGGVSMSTAAVETERCRSRGSGRSGFDQGRASGEAGSTSGANWERENGVPSKVAFFEKVLEAAVILRLDRLISLVEWECRQLVNTTTVVAVASVALRQGTEQLLKFCVHYLGTHIHPVLELHGSGCLPPVVQAKVDEERRHRVYALNSDSKDIAPDVAVNGVPPTLAFDAIAVGSNANGHANENTAGGSAAGETAAGASAPENPTLRDASAGQVQEQGNAANPNQVLPANGAGGAEVNGNGAYQVPVGPDEMEEDGVDNDNDAGYVNEHEDGDEEEDEQEDDDGFIDEEVEDDGSSSGMETQSDDDDDEEDGGAWLEPSHGASNLPAAVRRRLVPTVTGHTATAVLGSQMMVLGGGNKRQFHSCRHVLVYDPIERTWSKLATRGNAPAALIYHSCTALEPPWGCPRNLLVFGGNSTPRHINPDSHPKAQVRVLDSLTMEWIQPKIRGDPIGVRTRHTAVAVHADYEQHERENVQMDDDSLAGHVEELTAGAKSLDIDIDTGFSDGKGCGKRRAQSLERAQPRDIGADTDVIIFGGFSPIAGHAFNDIVVLNVHRSRGMFTSNGTLGGGRNDNSGDGGGGGGCSGRGGDVAAAYSASSGRSHPARRRRYSTDSDSDSSEQAESSPTGGNNHGYTYTWVHPMVRGTPPVGRLAHSSAVVRLPEDGEGGAGSGQQAYMVVFGGVGTGQVFNDVSALRCNSTRSLVWERVFVRGRRPSRRYGHSMMPLMAPSRSCGYAKLLLFGGTSGHTAFNDFFILDVSRGKVDGQFGILAKWETLKVGAIVPCPRSRQTMCQLNGEMIVFGGSDETPGTPNSQPISKEVDAFVYHVRPRLQKTPLGSSHCDEFGGGSGGGGGHCDEFVAGSGGGGGGGGGAGVVDGSGSSLASMLDRSPSPPQAATVGHDRTLLRWHEKSMAEEVIAHMGLVQAAQERRAEAARAAAGGVVSQGWGVASRPVHGAGGAETWNRELQRGPAMYPCTSAGIAAYLERVRATNGWLRPKRDWLPHENEPAKAPVRPYGVKVIWECIRPDAFVFEPGPEPPVVIRPGQLHKDTQTLIGNEHFSDVKFRFQAVDFGLPTTPTNTAHYAIVPPPTPTLPPCPKPGLPSPANATLMKELKSSGPGPRRSPPASNERSGAAGDGDIGCLPPSRLPSCPDDSVASPSGSGSGGATVEGHGSRRRNVPSVVLRSSAGQEWDICSPSRSVSPLGGWSIINRPASCSPLGPGHRSAAGGRRRFFGLSEAAEAEAEAALRAEGEREEAVAPARDDGVATSMSIAEKIGSDVGAGNPVIDAHRFLLSLRSDPMRAMLRSGMKETFASVCLVKDIRPPVFSALLTYIYTDTLQLQRPEDITELLIVANQYTLTDLLSLCEGFLQGVLDEENASHLYHYADSLAMPTFEHRCLTFILRNWHKVVRTEGWVHLPPELRARANAFRTKETHLFMLGQKDHVSWKGGDKDMMADWLLDRSPDTSWIEETLMQETFSKSGDERWQTASESEGESDGAAFFSPDSQSPISNSSP